MAKLIVQSDFSQHVVIHVTNLNDNGPGSLQAALDIPGPKFIIFDVAGEIILPTTISAA